MIEVGASSGLTGVAAAFDDFRLAFSSSFLARARWSSRGFSGSGFGTDLCGSQPERRANDGVQVMIRHAGADLRLPRMLSAKLDEKSRKQLVESCVKIKIYGAFVLNRRVVFHAIDATTARWRGDAGFSPLDGASTAASSLR